MNKVHTALSAAVLLLCALISASCAETSDSPKETDAKTDAKTETAAQSETEEVTKYESDDLPELDFNEYEFTVYREELFCFNGIWDADEEISDTINDAVYRRNLNVEERLNIKFSESVGECGSTKIFSTIMAGDDSYDACVNGGVRCITYSAQGLFTPVDDLKYIDLDKSYWDKTINDEISFNNIRYAFSGAANLPCYDFVHVLVFNKQIMTDNDLDSPYSLVKNGKWTFDEFEKMLVDITSDSNGDNAMTEEDTYGYVTMPKAILPALWIAAGTKTINKDESDLPVFTLPGDTKFAEVFSKTFEMIRDNNAWFYNTIDYTYDNQMKMFKEDHALFMDITCFYIPALRDMGTDFGILPYPKYTEDQKDYLSRIEDLQLLVVPTTSNSDRTSAVLEAITSESARTVIPEYYETLLKGKSTRDAESYDMLDIIYANRTVDLGDAVWFNLLRDGIFARMFYVDDRDLASKTVSAETQVNKTLDTIIDAYTAPRE